MSHQHTSILSGEPWTTEDTERIFDLSSDYTYREIGKMLNRTEEAVKKRAHKYRNELRRRKFESMGSFYGYPECCINDFVKRFKEGDHASLLQLKVSEYTGFIPCPAHAKEIKNGTITLEGLITNRKCKHNFPNEGK